MKIKLENLKWILVKLKKWVLHFYQKKKKKRTLMEKLWNQKSWLIANSCNKKKKQFKCLSIYIYIYICKIEFKLRLV